jgi:hypothetical protein
MTSLFTLDPWVLGSQYRSQRRLVLGFMGKGPSLDQPVTVRSLSSIGLQARTQNTVVRIYMLMDALSNVKQVSR